MLNEKSTEWPERDLEYLNKCPACGAIESELFIPGLEDFTYRVAPGKWMLRRCVECRAAYLTPRPTENSIGRTYRNYYTHNANVVPSKPLHWSGQGLKGRLKRGYLNERFGHKLPNTLPLGWLFATSEPNRKAATGHLIRHLGAPGRPDAQLLDVGCGNGLFLQIAKDLGYKVYGLEPDSDAAEQARGAGFDIVQGSLPNSGLSRSQFDHVTLNHVFEHLHRPREAAAELHALLKPGGRLWLSQPNLGAAGLQIFGKYWRGLESPRHLSLYTAESLKALLEKIGFVNITALPPLLNAENYFRQSVAMSAGKIPDLSEKIPEWTKDWKKKAEIADESAKNNATLAESLTIVAFKPML